MTQIKLKPWTQYYLSKGDVTKDNSQQRFLAQHSVAMLEQCCNHSKQCQNNVQPCVALKIVIVDHLV